MKTLSVLATSVLLTFGAVAPSVAATTQSVTAQGQIGINKAISIAKQKAQGKLKSVEFDDDDAEYEVAFASTTSKSEVKINSRTGAINSNIQKRLDSSEVAKYTSLNNAKVDLTEAIQIAARHSKGRVIEAEFDVENNTPVYEVKTVRSGEEYEVVVNANTGRVISMERD